MPENQQPQQEAFRPFYEKARALLGSIGDFAQHPAQQSELAMRIAQQMFLQHANAGRASSPLDPNNRPGLPEEALPASMGASAPVAGALTQASEQQARPPIQF